MDVNCEMLKETPDLEFSENPTEQETPDFDFSNINQIEISENVDEHFGADESDIDDLDEPDQYVEDDDENADVAQNQSATDNNSESSKISI